MTAPKFTNMIAAGCSFTKDGIGGTPPRPGNVGGNTFAEDTVPRSWASMLAQQYQCRSFVNVATSGHGNIVTAMAVRYLVDHFAYQPKDTVIVLNVTDPERFDLPCAPGYVLASHLVPWQRNLIPFSFVSRDSTRITDIQNEHGTDNVEYMTLIMLQGLFDYLRHRGFLVRFMTMRDYRGITEFDRMLDKYRDCYVPVGRDHGMMEHCLRHDLTVSPSDHHPNQQGHRVIADVMAQHLVQ